MASICQTAGARVKTANVRKLPQLGHKRKASDENVDLSTSDKENHIQDVLVTSPCKLRRVSATCSQYQKLSPGGRHCVSYRSKDTPPHVQCSLRNSHRLAKSQNNLYSNASSSHLYEEPRATSYATQRQPQNCLSKICNRDQQKNINKYKCSSGLYQRSHQQRELVQQKARSFVYYEELEETRLCKYIRHQQSCLDLTASENAYETPVTCSRTPRSATLTQYNNLHRGSPPMVESIHALSPILPDRKEKAASPAHSSTSNMSDFDKDLFQQSAIDHKIFFLQGGGQLKLSAYVNSGLLTVNVTEARHLSSKWKNLCSTYVKMSLIPDDCRRSRCKTKTVTASNQPVFQEQFSFELLQEDINKRLLISVWHKDNNCKYSEFMGCMSFGVRNLVEASRTVNGWYYLLTEDIGRRKHLQVATNQKLHCSNQSEHSMMNESANQTIEHFTIVVKRGRSGYGFALSGSRPVKVARVDEGSHAKKSGLQKGDSIIRINGQNVTLATSDSVAKIIRHSDKQIVIDVQRPLEMVKLERSPRKPTEPIKTQLNLSDQPSLVSLKKDNLNFSNQSAVKMETCFTVEKNVVTTTTTTKPASTAKVISKSQTDYQEERYRNAAVNRLMACEVAFIQAMQFGIQRYSRPLRHRVLSTQQHITTFQNIEKLAALSEYHYKQLNICQTSASGIYSNKTKVGGVYKSKVHFLCEAYETYCDGVEKAQQVLQSLHGNRELEGFLEESFLDNSVEPDILTFITKPTEHVSDLVNCLRNVLAHTPSSHEDYPDLVKVIDAMQESSNKQQEMSELEDQDMTSASNWKSITSLTSSTHSVDQDMTAASHWKSLASLTSSAHSVNTTATSIATDTTRDEDDTTLGDLLMTMDDSQEQSGVSSGSDQSTMMGSSVSVDQDVLELQTRVLFAKHVPAFTLAAPSRHIIYSGELQLCDAVTDGNGKTQKVMGILFSDLLLLTRLNADGFLTVIEDPIYLQKIFKFNFNCQHDLEFNIKVEPHGDVTLNSTRDLNSVVLRAPSMEQKFVWKSIMEHRILINQSVRDPLPLPCRIGDYVEDFGSS